MRRASRVTDRERDSAPVEAELQLEHRGVKPAAAAGEPGDEVRVPNERFVPADDVVLDGL
jgi:hypothetical protein